MRGRRRTVLAVALAVTTAVADQVWASAPAERAGERRQAIRRIAEETFDFAEVSRRSLGRHWAERTLPEREEFARVFADLLERTYFGQIGILAAEKVAFVGDRVEGDLALVRTRIVRREGRQISVDYHLHRRGDRWRAYDVVIEGVSLVANYRAQFNSIIRRHSFAGLVQRLRAARDQAGAIRRAASGP